MHIVKPLVVEDSVGIFGAAYDRVLAAAAAGWDAVGLFTFRVLWDAELATLGQGVLAPDPTLAFALTTTAADSDPRDTARLLAEVKAPAMLAMDDRMLKDIGISRVDALHEADRLPWDLTPRP